MNYTFRTIERYMNPAERLRTWRARKRAQEICQACGRRPIFKRKFYSQTYCFTKCKRCLKRAAWYQAEYRERQQLRLVVRHDPHTSA